MTLPSPAALWPLPPLPLPRTKAGVATKPSSRQPRVDQQLSASISTQGTAQMQAQLLIPPRWHVGRGRAKPRWGANLRGRRASKVAVGHRATSCWASPGSSECAGQASAGVFGSRAPSGQASPQGALHCRADVAVSTLCLPTPAPCLGHVAAAQGGGGGCALTLSHIGARECT